MKRLIDRKRLSVTWWWDDWSWSLSFDTIWVLDLGPLSIIWVRQPARP